MQKVRIICLREARYPVVSGPPQAGRHRPEEERPRYRRRHASGQLHQAQRDADKGAGALDIVGSKARQAKPGKLIGEKDVEGRFDELEGRMQRVYCAQGRDPVDRRGQQGAGQRGVDSEMLRRPERRPGKAGEQHPLVHRGRGRTTGSWRSVTEHSRKFSRNAEIMTTRREEQDPGVRGLQEGRRVG